MSNKVIDKNIPSLDDTTSKVLEALEGIRPFLKNDGGDIELIKIEDETVYIKLLGNCVGCPMSFSTMKLGVENMIKQFAPSIKKVINVED